MSKTGNRRTNNEGRRKGGEIGVDVAVVVVGPTAVETMAIDGILMPAAGGTVVILVVVGMAITPAVGGIVVIVAVGGTIVMAVEWVVATGSVVTAEVAIIELGMMATTGGMAVGVENVNPPSGI